ncbi:hypothetical protein [Cellvibrio sp. QJXJ]|uniref:hypothetical protein n=1 Tax=Cellvibrio sp. QJXJ TaxID=2964606 RepID=UPI0021C281C4|nr:hypothetical protein [Cellvibrio sp. QJXJ]UUA72008.1 hypothetical protein NNX04_16505 [Cellvibrio sp. QJXJ]
MNTQIERIRLNSKHISAGTSLADNPSFKEGRLETLAKDIAELCSGVQLTDNQRSYYEAVFKTISELKKSEGEAFRGRALGLAGQVNLLLNSFSS